MTERVRLKLRLPDGSELEAEGSPDFVRNERQAFLELPDNRTEHPRPQAPPPVPADKDSVAQGLDMILGSAVESDGSRLQLRAKLAKDKTEKDASLVLLAASEHILNLQKPTAAQLAKWLRASGYPIQRVDRAISEALSTGDILASGSRRARRYELTGSGKIKALHLSRQLAAAFQ